MPGRGLALGLMAGAEAGRVLEKARNRALLLLEHRERSRREMESRLGQAGFEPEVVAEVLEWLDRLNYLDDGRFARNYAAAKQRAGWGRVRIRHELLLKGVEADIIQGVLQPAADALGEAAWEQEEDGGGSPSRLSEAEQMLVATVRRKFARAATGDPRACRRRAEAFLARRGHPWPDIQRILSCAFGIPVEDGEEEVEP